MMKKLLISLVIFLPIVSSAQTKRVLFLGNSYTYSNNMPQIVADIASSMGDTLIFDSNTPGGYTLEGHSSNSTSFSKISQGNWDFISLQEQSQRPALSINQVIKDVFPYARYLDSLFKAYNPCGETVFFMTWGRKNGDSYYCPEWPPVCTYQGMDSLLRLRYMMMADSNDAIVSPVGAVWKYLRNNHPEIELYSPDESHPSPAGSYAAACSFYTTFFRKDPTQITYNFSLEIDVANHIKDAAKLVVFDSLLHWHVGEYDLSANFGFENIGGNTYQFTNLSKNAESYLWDFGEASDTAANPIYTFQNTGEHTVVLAAINECDTAYMNQLISIESIKKTKAKTEDVSIHQSKGRITIAKQSLNEIEIEILDITGKRVFYAATIDAITRTGAFRKGIYIVRIGSTKAVSCYKVSVL